jgi:hypothetical protein
MMTRVKTTAIESKDHSIPQQQEQPSASALQMTKVQSMPLITIGKFTNEDNKSEKLSSRDRYKANRISPGKSSKRYFEDYVCGNINDKIDDGLRCHSVENAY